MSLYAAIAEQGREGEKAKANYLVIRVAGGLAECAQINLGLGGGVSGGLFPTAAAGATVAAIATTLVIGMRLLIKKCRAGSKVRTDGKREDRDDESGDRNEPHPTLRAEGYDATEK